MKKETKTLIEKFVNNDGQRMVVVKCAENYQKF